MAVGTGATTVHPSAQVITAVRGEQVLGLGPGVRPVQGHQAGADEAVEPGGEDVAFDTHAPLELGEPGDPAEHGLPHDEQAPALSHRLEGAGRREVVRRFRLLGSRANEIHQCGSAP
jgi:hypothetical protein